MNSRLDQLRANGVSVWLDDLSRDTLVSGALSRRIEASEITGVTTNPTIFHRSIAHGRAYDDVLEELRMQRVSVAEALRLITAQDIRSAADQLGPLHRSTNGDEGWVSIEVDPGLAYDSERTVAAARTLNWMVGRPNVFVKIPATEESLPAVTACLAEGISVNVTLIFSPARYAQVMDAALAGMERALADGRSIQDQRSVASFFVSRLDSAVDPLLAGSAQPAASGLVGTVGISAALACYDVYRDRAGSSRWQALRQQGGHVTRPLWASTGTKNPRYSDTMYVDNLVTPGAVNTMPTATLDALKDHGSTGQRQRAGADELAGAAATLAALAAIGIKLEDIAGQLERDGVAAFAASWNALLSLVERRLARCAA